MLRDPTHPTDRCVVELELSTADTRIDHSFVLRLGEVGLEGLKRLGVRRDGIAEGRTVLLECGLLEQERRGEEV